MDISYVGHHSECPIVDGSLNDRWPSAWIFVLRPRTFRPALEMRAASLNSNSTRLCFPPSPQADHR
jgi:hypothetical protein